MMERDSLTASVSPSSSGPGVAAVRGRISANGPVRVSPDASRRNTGALPVSLPSIRRLPRPAGNLVRRGKRKCAVIQVKSAFPACRADPDFPLHIAMNRPGFSLLE
jgi:hypothetical protein